MWLFLLMIEFRCFRETHYNLQTQTLTVDCVIQKSSVTQSQVLSLNAAFTISQFKEFLPILNLPWSTVSVIFFYCKLLLTTPFSHVVNHTNLQTWANYLLHKKYIFVSLATEFQQPLKATSAEDLCNQSFIKCFFMAEQLNTNLKSIYVILNISRSGVKYTTTGLWSNGNMFSGIQNHASLSCMSCQMGKSGIGGCQENATYQKAQHQQKCLVWLIV